MKDYEQYLICNVNAQIDKLRSKIKTMYCVSTQVHLLT